MLFTDKKRLDDQGRKSMFKHGGGDNIGVIYTSLKRGCIPCLVRGGGFGVYLDQILLKLFLAFFV